MAYDSIKNLPSANIELDDDLNIKDLNLCIYNNEQMNMTDINNLPIHNKYKIDKAISEVEDAMNEKLKKSGAIGDIYVEDETGEMVKGNLKLKDIADKLGRLSASEVGVRYDMNSYTGLYTVPEGRRIIKSGNTRYIDKIDKEAENYEMGIAYLKSMDFDESEVDMSHFDQNNCFASKVYPWTDMKKVQIGLDDTSFNYDMSVDNGGNYYTEVPLYYIKEEFLLEKENKVTGWNGNSVIDYETITDLTSRWDNNNLFNGIPEDYRKNIFDGKTTISSSYLTTTNFIEVNKEYMYRIYCSNSTNIFSNGIYFYNENKESVKYSLSSTALYPGTNNYIMRSMPSGTKYIKISFSTSYGTTYNNDVSVIPIYKIGHYKWVSKYPLYGYRPADFFIDRVKKSVVEDDNSQPETVQRYVKVNICGNEYYRKYENYLESDSYSDIVPKKYILTDDSSADYIEILESKHYFACYKASLKNINGKSTATWRHELGNLRSDRPSWSTTLANWRKYGKNLSSNCYVLDMRAYNDFFSHLYDIEAKTLHCQTKLNGLDNIPYLNSGRTFFNQTNSDKLYTTAYPWGRDLGNIGNNIFVGSNYGYNQAFGGTLASQIPQIKEIATDMIEDEDFFVEKDENGEIVKYYLYDRDSWEVGTDESLALDSTEVRCKVQALNGNGPDLTDPYYPIITTTNTGWIVKVPYEYRTKFMYYMYYYNNKLYGTFANWDSATGAVVTSVVDNRVLVKIKLSLKSDIKDGYMYTAFASLLGSTDVINYRTGVMANYDYKNTHKRSIKWNWIENPWADMWKFIDGIHITHNANPKNKGTVHNAIYVCNKPDLYSDTYTGYELVNNYVAPGVGNNYIHRLGFDINYPWAQITSKSGKSSDTGYTSFMDYYYQNSSSGSTATRCVIAGGGWAGGSAAGLRCFHLGSTLGHSTFDIGCSFQRKEG